MEIDKDIIKKLQVKNPKDTIIAPITDEKVALVKKPIRDSLGRSYGTGGRKSAKARAWVKPGAGKITVNKKPANEYFKRASLVMLINQPFHATNTVNKFDVIVTVKGSGLSGQAGAVRHAISKALDNYDPEAYHKELRHSGLLTRDQRKVERKKYGHRKARKKRQFSKR